MTLPHYHQATYRYSVVFQCHIISRRSDEHPLLPIHMTLDKPLDANAYPGVTTTLQASSTERRTLYWGPWHKTPLANVYSFIHQADEETYLMIFSQPRKGLREPFRQLVFAVDDTLPRAATFYKLLVEELLTLPPLESG